MNNTDKAKKYRTVGRAVSLAGILLFFLWLVIALLCPGVIPSGLRSTWIPFGILAAAMLLGQYLQKLAKK